MGQDHRTLLPEAEREIHLRIAAAWNAGWQPLELARQVRRTADAVVARLALVAISADHAGRDRSALDARWVAQLTELDLPPIESTGGWLAKWGDRERMEWPGPAESAV